MLDAVLEEVLEIRRLLLRHDHQSLAFHVAPQNLPEISRNLPSQFTTLLRYLLHNLLYLLDNLHFYDIYYTIYYTFIDSTIHV